MTTLANQIKSFVVNHSVIYIPLAAGGQTAGSAPATGPPAGRQRRGSAEGCRSSARIPQVTPPNLARRGEIKKADKKDTGTQAFYLTKGCTCAYTERCQVWALYGKGGVRHATTNWVKQCDAPTACRPLESTAVRLATSRQGASLDMP
jgi:hypothetical protein